MHTHMYTYLYVENANYAAPGTAIGGPPSQVAGAEAGGEERARQRG